MMHEYLGVMYATEDEWFEAHYEEEARLEEESLKDAEELADLLEWDSDDEREAYIQEHALQYINDEDWRHEKSLRW